MVVKEGKYSIGIKDKQCILYDLRGHIVQLLYNLKDTVNKAHDMTRTISLPAVSAALIYKTIGHSEDL